MTKCGNPRVPAGWNGRDAGMTYREAAMRLLRERGPMHYRALAQSIEFLEVAAEALAAVETDV